MVTTFSASNIETELEALVDNWLTDVQRRGAELYAVNRGPQIVCLSFEGKGALRYTVKIDYAVKDVRVQITGPRWNFVERNAFLLNAENLRSLSNRMCRTASPENKATGTPDSSTHRPRADVVAKDSSQTVPMSRSITEDSTRSG